MLSSLPTRPLSVDELQSLHRSGSLVAAAPINVVLDPDQDRSRSLVVSAVLATEAFVVGVSYDPSDQTWNKVIQKENGPESEKGPDGTVESVIMEAESALEQEAERLEEDGEVGEIFGSDVEDGVNADYRDGTELNKVLQKQYDEYTQE
ncbi:hypothetical protein [Halorubrum sp. AJ67]|uniref:hypothetical protein n=1 Tax=Halorubrum sp. AJ67 TaxID=1173487 RepID=UPI0003DCEE6B|nr:hypothetical protein [Halorubrum sp. AJ67]CDK38000.1 hypothetical protein BN903_200 [Halorubrum sp. AJ67]